MDGKKTVTCPECMNDIDLDTTREYQVGDIIECPFCGSELEISRISDEGIEVNLVIAEK